MMLHKWGRLHTSQVARAGYLFISCYDGFSLINRHHNTMQGATFLRDHPVDNPSSYYLQKKDELSCWLKDFEWKCRNLIQHAKENPMILPAEYIASEQE